MGAKSKPTTGQISFLIWLSKFATVSGLNVLVEQDKLLVRAPHGGQFEAESGLELVHLFDLEAERLEVQVISKVNDYGVAIEFSS
jgi:hypothetical protein